MTPLQLQTLRTHGTTFGRCPRIVSRLKQPGRRLSHWISQQHLKSIQRAMERPVSPYEKYTDELVQKIQDRAESISFRLSGLLHPVFDGVIKIFSKG